MSTTTSHLGVPAYSDSAVLIRPMAHLRRVGLLKESKESNTMRNSLAWDKVKTGESRSTRALYTATGWGYGAIAGAVTIGGGLVLTGYGGKAQAIGGAVGLLVGGLAGGLVGYKIPIGTQPAVVVGEK